MGFPAGSGRMRQPLCLSLPPVPPVGLLTLTVKSADPRDHPPWRWRMRGDRSGILLIKSKRLKMETLIVLIILVGMIMRVGYMLYTSLGQRGHDVAGFDDSGHLDYVYQIFKTGRLPQAYDYQFYHPPLNAILQAIVVKVFSWFQSGSGLVQLFEAAKIVPCFASCALLLVCYSLFRELRMSARAIALSLGVLAFQPTFYLFSASINNDSLMLLFYMIAVLYTVRWYHAPKLKNILVIALAIGLGMSTKLSAVTVAAFTAPVFLLMLVRRIREKNALPVMGQYAAFAVVCLPLGLWYSVRNRILFRISYRYMYTLSRWNDLYCGDGSLVKRFPVVSCRAARQSTLLHDLIRTTISGCIWRNALYLGSTRLNAPLWLLRPFASNLLLIVLSIAAMIYVLFAARKLAYFRARFGLLWIWLIQMGSFVMFNLMYPFGCTMDLRYIVPTVVVGAAYLGIALDRLKGKNDTGGNSLVLLRGVGRSCWSPSLRFCSTRRIP